MRPGNIFYRAAKLWRKAWLWSLLLLLILFSLPAPPAAQAQIPPYLSAAKPVAIADWDADGDLDYASAYAFYDVDQDGRLDYGDLFVSRATLDKGEYVDSVYWHAEDQHNFRSLAWADWDGDGDLDLAAGIWGEPNRIYEQEDGSFHFDPAHGLGWQSPDATETTSIAWADWDGDGDLDLAVGNYLQPNQVFRNEGGSLTLAWEASEAQATTSVAWADWDNDGDPDMAVGNYLQPNLIYETEAGTLAIDPAQKVGWRSPDATATTNLDWADWDRDGDLDLAFGNAGQPVQVYETVGDELRINLLAQEGWTSPYARLTYGLAWGDWDNDGWPDLAVANFGDTNLRYLNRRGTTMDVESFVERNYSWGVAWGDLNGNGTLDLLFGEYNITNKIEINPGGASLSGTGWMLGRNQTMSVAWGDWDGDRDLDLAVGNRQEPSQVYENENGALLLDPENGLGWQAPAAADTNSVAWGDWDNDGDLDLATGNRSQVNQVYENENGTLLLDPANGLGWEAGELLATTSVAWGDWDIDGDLDLAVGALEGVYVYENEDGTLRLAPEEGWGWRSDEAQATVSVAWGDWDGDGDLDLAVGNYGNPNRVYENANGILTLDPANGFGWQADVQQATNSVAWGDWDGDGDLDLAVGNQGQNSLIYANEGGTFVFDPVNEIGELLPDVYQTTSVAWGDWDGDGALDLAIAGLDGLQVYKNQRGGNRRGFLPGSLWRASGQFTSIAWADVDQDGDLDLAAGQFPALPDSRNVVLENPSMAGERVLAENGPRIVVRHPHPAGVARTHGSAEVLRGQHLAIAYTLFDPEGDPVPRIHAYYSPNGGGQWIEATPATGVITQNLKTSPQGVTHTFVWDAAADLIRNDNLVFRIEAEAAFRGPGSQLWPVVAAQTLPFRLQAAEWYVRAVDEQGDPQAGVLLYVDGQLATGTDGRPLQSDRAGLMHMVNPAPGQRLVALSQVYEAPSARSEHDGWAYRTYQTSLVWDEEGEVTPWTTAEAGEQRLVLSEQRPLILFNLLVSLEWDATAEYLAEIERAMLLASDYLYDFTDGQMAFGYVRIWEDSMGWADADIQISTKNIVHPHAYVGGILAEDKSHVVRLGRGWDGNSGNSGPWDATDGYRTLAHEFAHYALHLYDEYFTYLFDGNGNLSEIKYVKCLGPGNRIGESDATNASVMDWQYTSSELSARGVAGLWSRSCENTAQTLFNQQQSAWETVRAFYGDAQPGVPPEWQLVTPLETGRILAGPSSFPRTLMPFPRISVEPVTGKDHPPRQLTLLDHTGTPLGGALVTLYKQNGRVISQGIPDAAGQIVLYGAEAGDTVRSISFDGALSGKVVVGEELSLTLQLQPVAAAQAASGAAISLLEPPYLRVFAEPSAGEQIELLVSVENGAVGANLELLYSEPGSTTVQSQKLSYSPERGSYASRFRFSATASGTGRIRIVGASAYDHLQATYRLHWVDASRPGEVYSDDGNISLFLAPESLPGLGAYVVIMPPGALPGPLPAGYTLVGDLYDLTAGVVATLDRPAILSLHTDAYVADSRIKESQLRIFRWDAAGQRWRAVANVVDEERHLLVAPVNHLGIYAVLASPTQEQVPVDITPRLFLPRISR